MASKGGCFLQAGIFPDDDLIIRIPMRTHDFLGVLGEHQIAHLRPRVNAVQQRTVEGVPELDGLVGRASARSQDSMVVRTPSNALHRSGVRGKFTDGCRTFSTPNE